MYLNFGSYRYRGSDIRTVLLSIPEPAPDAFGTSGFSSADHTYYTLILASRRARAANSVVVICRVNEELESRLSKNIEYRHMNIVLSNCVVYRS